MTSTSALSIQTVFLPRENIMFLEEWMAYHVLLGVEHFYLYDNTGSIGRQGSNQTTSKHGVNFYELTKHLSDADIEERMHDIFERIQAEVTLVKWQPKNDKGKIVYAIADAIKHFYQNFRDKNDWVAFIDIDEFIFSPTNINVSEILQESSALGVSELILKQKKFLDRFRAKTNKVINIYDCIEGIDTARWGSKVIIRINDLNVEQIPNIHSLQVCDGKLKPVDEQVLRFNHYNVNAKELKWMKRFYNSKKDFHINAVDHGM